IGLAARSLLVAQDGSDKDRKVFGGRAGHLKGKLAALQRIADDLVGRVGTEVHRASPRLCLGVFLCWGRSSTSKLSTPGSSDRLRPLSHRMSSWPAPSTAKTVPQVPSGTRSGSSGILTRRTRVPGG